MENSLKLPLLKQVLTEINGKNSFLLSAFLFSHILNS